MTDIKGNHKAGRKENKRNDINRPKARQRNERTPERYENFDGEPIE
jgi:hypothetical protein